MKVIVTNNAVEYQGFLKLKSLEEVIKTSGDIEALVYHKSNEQVDKCVEYLTKLKDRVSNFIYIRNKDTYEQAIQMIVVGSGGRYFDDEFFLESGSELNNLVNNLGEVTQLAELGGLGVMSEFFNKYLNGGSSGFNKAYLQVVKDAVSGMLTDYKKKDAEILQMSETATELFSNTMSILSGVEEEKEKLQASIQALEEARDKGLLTGSSSPIQNSVYFFPRVSYLKERNIVKIKEIGSCAFLTSFVMGMRLYLERVKYLKTKLVFIYPVGWHYEGQYSQYAWITQNNNKTMRSYVSDIVFVNYPTKEVMSRLLDDDKHEVFIIVDRTSQGSEHILNSKGVVKYAVSGNSSMKNMNIKAKDSFSPVPVIGSMFQVKYNPKYQVEADQRERYYLREYDRCYDMLFMQKKV